MTGTDDTSKFTVGALADVARALDGHGYHLDGTGLVELQQHLLHLLHGSGGRCTGGTRPAASCSGAVSPLLDWAVSEAAEWLADCDQKLIEAEGELGIGGVYGEATCLVDTPLRALGTVVERRPIDMDKALGR